MSRRADRVSELLQQELSAIISTELRDPRLKTLVTVTHVDVSVDLQHASVLLSVMGDPAAGEEAVRAMESAVGFLRRELGHRLRLRSVPALRFAVDTSLAEGDHTLALLDQVLAEEAKHHD